jgi:hypothetical protein
LNFYQILEVSANADEEEIRRSFRRLAKQYHPDVNKSPDAADHFRLIYMAYDILQDSFKRQLYDELQREKASYSNNTGPTMTSGQYERYRRRAERQARSYAAMKYDEFEETFMEKVGFHLSQTSALVIFFILLCAGLVGLLSGIHFFRADFNGSTLVAYSLTGLGGALVYVSVKALWGVFDTWKK